MNHKQHKTNKKAGILILLLAEKDYYPFGWTMPGRQWTSSDAYRYGYQSLSRSLGRQFAEDETAQTGFHAFELRLYDSRIGRWTSVDPAGVGWSPYIGMGNNPVSAVDPRGDIPFLKRGFFKRKLWYNPDDGFYYYRNGKQFTGEWDNDMIYYATEIDFLGTTEVGKAELNYLYNTDKILLVIPRYVDNSDDASPELFEYYNKLKYYWYPLDVSNDEGNAYYINTIHEFAHVIDHFRGTINVKTWLGGKNKKYGYYDIPESEKFAVHVENMYRAECGAPLRRYYNSSVKESIMIRSRSYSLSKYYLAPSPSTGIFDYYNNIHRTNYLRNGF